MKTLIVTPFLLQGNILVEALRRENIDSELKSPHQLRQNKHFSPDAVLFPHVMNDFHWGMIHRFLKNCDRSIPLIPMGHAQKRIFSETPFKTFLKSCVFISDALTLNQTPGLIRDIIQKNQSQKQARKLRFRVGNIILDIHHRSVIYNKKEFFLTRKEFFLLELLMVNAGQVITRSRIIDHVWDKHNYVSNNTIEVYISRLRKKLDKKSRIKTIPCLGYKFQVE